jgi:hypothetical protein
VGEVAATHFAGEEGGFGEVEQLIEQAFEARGAGGDGELEGGEIAQGISQREVCMSEEESPEGAGEEVEGMLALAMLFLADEFILFGWADGEGIDVEAALAQGVDFTLDERVGGAGVFAGEIG